MNTSVNETVGVVRVNRVIIFIVDRYASITRQVIAGTCRYQGAEISQADLQSAYDRMVFADAASIAWRGTVATSEPGVKHHCCMNPDYQKTIADAFRDQSADLADKWLARLQNVVNEELWEIFPTVQYLDHIPAMIKEIGDIIERPEFELALANSIISRKGLQLGALRHQQKASVNQILREYDLLAHIFEDFLQEKTNAYTGNLDQDDAFELTHLISRIVRFIMQNTVDAFVENYIHTIDEQTEKLISFNRFVSHELRTPLQSALLNLELVMEGHNLNDEDTLDLLKVQTGIQQAATLITNIENMTKTKSVMDGDNPVRQCVDLTGLLKDIQIQLEQTLATRSIRLEIDEDLGELDIESAKLKLVLTNLLSNAVKYSDPAKSDCVIKVYQREETAIDSVCLVIEDNGLGIEDDMLSEVFNLRVRAHAELDSDNEVNGEGIGLYLVDEAISELGGSIALESSVGKGTSVIITLPGKRKSDSA